MSNIEQTRPKLRYRMERELLESLRRWADQHGVTVSDLLEILARGVVSGTIEVEVHSRASGEVTLHNRRRAKAPAWMKPPKGEHV